MTFVLVSYLNTTQEILQMTVSFISWPVTILIQTFSFDVIDCTNRGFKEVEVELNDILKQY